MLSQIGRKNQTYDDVIKELIDARNRGDLSESIEGIHQSNKS
jgi:hypothetical protein